MSLKLYTLNQKEKGSRLRQNVLDGFSTAHPSLISQSRLRKVDNWFDCWWQLALFQHKG